MWGKNKLRNDEKFEDIDRMTFKDIIACIIAEYMILAPIVFGAVLIMFLLLLVMTKLMR